MANAFILAGFDVNETAATERYTMLESGLRAKGYNPIAVDVSWRRKTIMQYVEPFVSFYKQHKSDRNIIIGNSFGAAAALIAAPKTNPDALYLCSVSPFFKEDYGKYPDAYGIKYFGKRRMEDFWALSARATAEQINASTISTTILYGEKEHQMSPALVTRCKEIAQQIHNTQIYELPGAPHDMAATVYSKELLNHVAQAATLPQG